MAKYLDATGVSTLWGKIKGTFLTTSTADSRYLRHYSDSSLDANSAAQGWHDVANNITNAAHTNHSALIYVSNVGTPFQLQIPDSTVDYIYKRSYSGGWSSWRKMKAGDSDTLEGHAASYFATSGHTHDSSYLKYSGYWDCGETHDSTTATGMVFAYSNHGVPGVWGTLTTFAPNSGSSYNLQLYGDGWNNEFYLRTRSADNGQHEWRKVIHSGNYTSYTVKKDGTGATGTWGIDVTGSAGSVPWSGITNKPEFTYGLNNLCSGVLSSGGNTTKIDNWTIQINGENKDTYFTLSTIEAIDPNQEYTLGFYVEGYEGGGVYVWPVGQQSNSQWTVAVTRNGWVWGTGKYLNASASKTLFMDDGVRQVWNQMTFKWFTLVKGNHFPYFNYPGYNESYQQTKIGDNTIYHTGNLPAYPTKASWNYDDVYLKLSGGTLSGDIKATSFIKSGGTSAQFLKADGSVDNNSYASSSHDHSRLGRTTITSTDFNKAQWSGFYNVTADGSTALPGANTGGNVAIHAAWDNGSNTAGLDLLINDSTVSSLYFRSRVGGGGIGAWRTIIDSSNIGSQSVNYSTSSGNSDTLDYYHAEDILKKICGRNLIKKSVISGGRTAVEGYKIRATPKTNQGDTYFYITPINDLPAGKYIFSFTCSGFYGNDYWNFAWQNSSTQGICAARNGRNIMILNHPSLTTAGTNILIDDYGSETAANSDTVYFYDFALYSYDTSDYSVAPEEIITTYNSLSNSEIDAIIV